MWPPQCVLYNYVRPIWLFLKILTPTKKKLENKLYFVLIRHAMCIYRKHKTIRVSRYIYIIAIVVVVLIIPQCYTYLCSSTRSRKFYKKTKRRKDPQGDDRRAIWMLNVLHTCIICGVMCSVQKYIARHSHLTLAMSLLLVDCATGVCLCCACHTSPLSQNSFSADDLYIFKAWCVCWMVFTYKATVNMRSPLFRFAKTVVIVYFCGDNCSEMNALQRVPNKQIYCLTFIFKVSNTIMCISHLYLFYKFLSSICLRMLN